MQFEDQPPRPPPQQSDFAGTGFGLAEPVLDCRAGKLHRNPVGAFFLERETTQNVFLSFKGFIGGYGIWILFSLQSCIA